MKATFVRKSIVVLAAVVTMGFPGATRASASIIVSIQSGLSAAAGTTGNSFEVDITNTGTVADVIDSFAFEVATASANITFTASTDGTANPYIFAGNSTFGPDLNLLSPGQSMDGSDVTAGSDYSLDGGSTIAIGEVFYDVADGASTGPVIISFLPSTATTFSDINGNLFDIQSMNSGHIAIAQGTVPEPSSLSIMGLALTGIALNLLRLAARRALSV